MPLFIRSHEVRFADSNCEVFNVFIHLSSIKTGNLFALIIVILQLVKFQNLMMVQWQLGNELLLRSRNTLLENAASQKSIRKLVLVATNFWSLSFSWLNHWIRDKFPLVMWSQALVTFNFVIDYVSCLKLRVVFWGIGGVDVLIQFWRVGLSSHL